MAVQTQHEGIYKNVSTTHGYVELLPEHTSTRAGDALGATVIFPGGREEAVVGIDPHFLPKNVRQREAKRLAAQRQQRGGAAHGARARL